MRKAETVITVSVSIPEYTVERQPDYLSIGKKLDKVIETNFKGKRIAARGISLVDHPDFSLDTLVSTIVKSGTDRYDSRRKGVSHEEFEPYRIDMHALPCEVSDSGLVSDYYGNVPSVMGRVVKDFYEGALLDRGYSVRLDILLIYDLDQLTQAQRVDETKPRIAPRLEPLLFRFKDPLAKYKALVGIVKILKCPTET